MHQRHLKFVEQDPELRKAVAEKLLAGVAIPDQHMILDIAQDYTQRCQNSYSTHSHPKCTISEHTWAIDPEELIWVGEFEMAAGKSLANGDIVVRDQDQIIVFGVWQNGQPSVYHAYYTKTAPEQGIGYPDKRTIDPK